MSWSSVTFFLCLYGFLKELRPSEPFLTEYLIDQNYVNITLQEAYYDVYPIWTYSYLAVLVIVFLLTDFLRYKPVIVVEGFAYIATWCLLVWGSGVPMMQLMQFTYGTATSTEVAYFTYIYAKVEKKFYQRVTSMTRASLLFGRFLSGFLAQIFTSYGLLNFLQLNIFSLVSVTLATVISILLPPIKNSIYFHQNRPQEEFMEPLQSEIDNRENLIQRREESSITEPTIQSSLKKIGKDFKQAFGNGYILKWSLWWALGMCGNFQVGNYIQPLWETIQPVSEDHGNIYNGAVEAAATLSGAILSIIFGYLHFNWSLVGEPVLSLLSFIHGLILIFMALTDNIWTAYVGYWAFRALFQMLITVASYEVARNIVDDSYGLVFGFNTFLALFFQTILTVVVADDAGLALDPRTQFMVYGSVWIVIGFIYVTMFCIDIFCRKNEHCFCARYKAEGLWLAPMTAAEAFGPDTRRDVPLGMVEPQ